jgi:alkylhydroperoxidase family enzyme
MSDEAKGHLQRLWQAVTAGPGVLPAAERLAIAEGSGAPAGLADYVGTVRANAYKVTDDSVAALKQSGYGDEAIFEATVAAAVGAGFDRRDAAMRALEGLD